MPKFKHFRNSLLVTVLLISPSVALACLWDSDTLKQELDRFPGVLELMTGKFLRHSPEFYEWRIKDRLHKLESDSNNLALHDDLAVAYQKTGKTNKAIEVMFAKEKIKPGEYETYSNLGTFYILAGNFEEGLLFIDKALIINPNAHFGREKYQKWLIEYAMKHHGSPMQSERKGVYTQPNNFRSFLAEKLMKKTDELTRNELDTATKAVLGMMRFADHDNPLLLEALGDLLDTGSQNLNSDAKQLSARAYLAASYRMKDNQSKDQFRKLAEATLELQFIKVETPKTEKLAHVETQFKKELEDANIWYANLRQKELDWIAAGVDVDAEFDKLYADNDPSLAESRKATRRWWIAGGISLAVLIAVGVFVVRKFLF